MFKNQTTLHQNQYFEPVEQQARQLSQKQTNTMPKNPKGSSSTSREKIIIGSPKVYAVSNFKNLSFNDLSELFNIPMSAASLALGVSESYLKRLCRVMNIARWPYRKLEALRVQILTLEQSKSGNCLEVKRKIETLQTEIRELRETGVDTSPKRARGLSPKTCRSSNVYVNSIENPALKEEQSNTHQAQEPVTTYYLCPYLPTMLMLDVAHVQYCLNHLTSDELIVYQ